MATENIKDGFDSNQLVMRNLEETHMLLQHAFVIAELGVDSIKPVVDSFEPRVQLVKKPAIVLK